MATTTINGITVNKITKSQFETEKLAGHITAEMEQNEVWLFTDDQHVSASEKASWNSKSDFNGDYNSLTNKPIIPTVPTNVSAFTNDAGYLTTIPSGYITETELSSAISGKADVSDIPNVSGFETKTDASNKLAEAKTYTNTKVSNLVGTAPTTLDTLQEIATAIQENETVVEALNDAIGNKANKSDLATVATTGSYNDLNDKPTLFSGSYNDLTNKPTMFSGEYEDLQNKPTIPTAITKIWE